MSPLRPIPPHREQLDAQAAAFAHLLGLAPDDADGAYRTAIALGDGLFPHQIEGVAFLLGRRRAILADDMGLGKTRQAIVSLRHASSGGPYLVVCPASVKRNWAREIELAIPVSSVRVVEGSGPATCSCSCSCSATRSGAASFRSRNAIARRRRPSTAGRRTGRRTSTS